MRRLLAYLRPYRGRALGALGLLILSSLLQLVGPLATAVALDLFVRPLGARGRSPAVSRSGPGRLAAGIGLELTPAQGIAAAASVYLACLALAFVVLYLQG